MHPRWAHDATRKSQIGEWSQKPLLATVPSVPYCPPQEPRLACVLTPSIWAFVSVPRDLEGVPRAGEAERVWAQGPSQVA